jgi:hypothetical protein
LISFEFRSALFQSPSSSLASMLPLPRCGMCTKDCSERKTVVRFLEEEW